MYCEGLGKEVIYPGVERSAVLCVVSTLSWARDTRHTMSSGVLGPLSLPHSLPIVIVSVYRRI